MIEFPISMSKKEIEIFIESFNTLKMSSIKECISIYNTVYSGILSNPPPNPDFRGLSPEQVFFRLIRKHELLCLGYYLSLENNTPQILLDALQTYNSLMATHELKSGYDHCSRFRNILFCFAGNNYDIVDYLYPQNIGLSTSGYGFLIAGTNLILALRNDSFKDEVITNTNAFLLKKNTAFENEVILSLKSILLSEVESFSEHLNNVTEMHKKSKWLQDFNNDMSKYFPIFSYGILSIAHTYFSKENYAQIQYPKNGLWWNEFVDNNIKNAYTPGKNLIDFEGQLSFLNEIRAFFFKQ